MRKDIVEIYRSNLWTRIKGG